MTNDTSIVSAKWNTFLEVNLLLIIGVRETDRIMFNLW